VIRSISALTGTVEEMSDGYEAELSSDGGRIAFIDGGGAIQIAGSRWESPRTFLRPPEGEVVVSVHWLPGGKRIGYLIGQNGAPDAEIQTRDVNGGDMKPIVRANTESVVFAPDGGVFYSTKDPAPQSGASLWMAAVNSATGDPAGQPVRLATWPGLNAAQPLTLSADGRRLAFTKQVSQSDVYQLQLDSAGNAVINSRQLTTDTQADWPSAWVADGSAMLFYSNRHGALHAFRQPIASESPQTIVSGASSVRAPQLSANGKWIVYIEMGSAPDTARVMRMPKDGGPAQQVVSIASRLGTARMDFFGVLLGTAGIGAHSLPDLRCPAHVVDGSCLLLEQSSTGTAQDSRVVLSRLDPETGHTRELATLAPDQASGTFWDVSPDGATVAFGQWAWGAGDRITLLHIATGERTIIQPAKVKNLCDVGWAFDGRSLFAAVYTVRGAELLHIALDGAVHSLRSYDGQLVVNPRPSPDGHSLLIGLAQTNSNVWVIDR
jgi:hypothetical protein